MGNSMKIKLIILLYFITDIFASDPPLVEISNGWLQGTLEKSYNGRTFSSFEGIPYAKPPVGGLRFEAPHEPYNWTGIWIANTKHTCVQSGFDGTITGQEDCLYLNVYVPSVKPTSFDNLNVIVHIHGGGFSMWAAHTYAGPKYLMDEDVIYVTLNYRLGALGFLSTADDVVPGNNGLKDQVLSLKWIQNNIRYFGGNPNSVTITGMSAGSASVHFHYFSPLSKGLFHRGVSSSGTALDPWAIQTKPLDKANYLAELVGCPTETSNELVECLKTRSANDIVKAQTPLPAEVPTLKPIFAPVIEIEHEDAFLIEDPYDMLLSAKVADVPWVVSSTEHDGHLFLNFVSIPISQLYEEFEKYAPLLLMYSDDIDNEAEKLSISNDIKNHYFKDAHLHDLKDDIGQILSDRMFLAGADTSAKLQAKANRSPVYFYIFGYRGQHTFNDMLVQDADNTRATHGDDILYYLYSSLAEEKLSAQDEDMKTIFLQWLVTFADGQEPDLNDLTWTPVDGGEILKFIYFEDPDNVVMETAEGLGANALWNRLSLARKFVDEQIKDEL